MKTKQRIRACSVLLPGLLISSASAQGVDPVRTVEESVALLTDVFDGDGQTTQIAERHTIERMGTNWMRLRIGDFQLGEGSFITTSSLLDGRSQRHTAATLAEWDNWTAFFNGDALEVILHVGPHDNGAFVTIDRVLYPEVENIFHAPDPGRVIASICGETDNRIASNDSRVGRLFRGGCTGWLISNGGALTAGHCTNDSGDIGGVLEFNVPPSTSNGVTVWADPADQYPVVAGSEAFQNNGNGEDWAQFRVGANTETGLRAHIVQGFFRLADSLPAVDSTMRVTGFGIDNRPEGTGFSTGDPACCDPDGEGPETCGYNCNSASGTLQTHAGRLDDIEGYTIEHEADTMPANSGGPVIWESTGYAIGIHTSAGCDSFILGYNNFGTHFTHPTLASFINNLRGSNAVYVDSSRNITLMLGTVFRPWETVAQGAAAVANGGVVSIVEGNYPASAGNTFTAGADGKQMTLEAPVGVVTIGN